MKISEIFYSIQGEGVNTGIPTTFIRLYGCNLNCEWCDTKYARSGEYREMSVDEIVSEVGKLGCKRICLTGGEPFLQNCAPLIRQLLNRGYIITAETNGTCELPHEAIHHLTVSPKKGHRILETVRRRASEVKYVITCADDLKNIWAFARNVSLQPMDNDPEIIRLIIEHLRDHSTWRLSLQCHKFIRDAWKESELS